MIIIRKAAFGDLEALQKIGRDTFSETFTESNTEADMQQYLAVNFSLDKLTCEITDNNSLFFIAWDEESAIGYLKVNLGQAQTELQEEHSLEIERIYVLNAYHGKKVGQFLYEKALEVAGQLRKSSVWLGVWEKNPRAIRFYEKNGFVTFGTHVFKMGTDEQTDLMMRKSLDLPEAKKISSKAENILGQIHTKTKLGDLRTIAKDIKKDHELAIELWSTRSFFSRLLSILIMDKNLVSQDFINELDKNMQTHPLDEQTQLMDWFMANQLMKDKKTIAMIESWEDSLSPLQRRVFWYYQARLRWTGQTPPDNTPELLTKIEAKIAKEDPVVQWAMNFTAGWIGVHEKKYRNRCVALGEKTGLYKGQMVSKGCTPNYLPEFIAIESNKRNL